MKREFKVEANIGAPQVAYRETITKDYEMDYTHKNNLEALVNLLRVKLSVEPLDAGKGREVENMIKGGEFQKKFIPGVEKGIESVAENGVLAGFPGN